MSQELSNVLDQIWRSGSGLAEALRLSHELPQTSSQQLLNEFELLADMSLTNKTNSAPTELPSLGSTSSIVEPNADLLARLLLLLVFGIYHSDSLVYLPPEMRQERLVDWAKATNFEIEVVRKAATLGPAGLGALIGKS